MLDDFIGFIQGQEMPTVLNCHHFGPWHKQAVLLSFIGSGPVLTAPEEEDRNPDAGIVLGRHLPASGVSEQADERSVVAFPVARQIHLFEQWRRDAARRWRGP